MKLIRNNIPEFIEKIGTDKPFNLIDIGCGDGTKAKEFIKATRGKVKIRYCPISPTSYLTKKAVDNIKRGKFNNIVEYKPYNITFDSLQDIVPMLRSNKFQKNVMLLHGSILASYEINDYLFNLGKEMFNGDYIIIGNGVREGERFVEIEKYRHEAFNNWFIHLMKILGFKESECEYDAVFRNGRMESFYRIKVDKKIEHKTKEIKFKKGDEILVFKLYKYYPKELEKFFNMYFCEVDIVKDKGNEYILALCKK